MFTSVGSREEGPVFFRAARAMGIAYWRFGVTAQIVLEIIGGGDQVQNNRMAGEFQKRRFVPCLAPYIRENRR